MATRPTTSEGYTCSNGRRARVTLRDGRGLSVRFVRKYFRRRVFGRDTYLWELTVMLPGVWEYRDLVPTASMSFREAALLGLEAMDRRATRH